MAYYTYVDNAVPTAAQWNANVRDQVVNQCTSATRPTAVEGMVIYETDTDRLLYYSGSAWVIITEPRQTWTPTITQSGTVTGTVNRGWYRRQNGLWEARLKWTSTGAGTASNAIAITTPVTMLDAADVGGTFVINDSGTTIYAGAIFPSSTSAFNLIVNQIASAFGTSTYTIASTDVFYLTVFGTY